MHSLFFFFPHPQNSILLFSLWDVMPKQFICIFFDINPQDYKLKSIFTWMHTQIFISPASSLLVFNFRCFLLMEMKFFDECILICFFLPWKIFVDEIILMNFILREICDGKNFCAIHVSLKIIFEDQYIMLFLILFYSVTMCLKKLK